MNVGKVFDIQRFSINDGPGVRTSVFLKGCNLRCAWCHNPESQAFHTEIRYTADKCICCGLCIEACPVDAHRLNSMGMHMYERVKCKLCKRCAEACSAHALEVVGRNMSVEQVMEVVRKDSDLYDYSGGGLTVTGGEPLMQAEFTLALLRSAHAELIHTAIETAGEAPWVVLKRIAAECDLVLFDFKGFDSERHQMNTGVRNDRILANLQKLAKERRLFVRMPLISGVNDFCQEAERAADFLSRLPGVEQIELLPYHRFGEPKYADMGRKAQCFGAPDSEKMKRLTQIYRQTGKKVIEHGS